MPDDKVGTMPPEATLRLDHENYLRFHEFKFGEERPSFEEWRCDWIKRQTADGWTLRDHPETEVR